MGEVYEAATLPELMELLPPGSYEYSSVNVVDISEAQASFNAGLSLSRTTLEEGQELTDPIPNAQGDGRSFWRAVKLDG